MIMNYLDHSDYGINLLMSLSLISGAGYQALAWYPASHAQMGYA